MSCWFEVGIQGILMGQGDEAVFSRVITVKGGRMRVNLMIEGQEGVPWGDWLAIAGAAEQHGLEGLFRSDHYASVRGRRDIGSLDAWATLAGLAAVTDRIRLGTLVSPASFRHPSVLAKMVATVDQISGGRVELGLGAGWYEAEHVEHGFEFHPDRKRVDVLAEQLAIVTHSWVEDVVDFEGEHYSLSGAKVLPKPLQQPHPPIIVGGSGGPRSLALAARWADEYNQSLVGLDETRSLKQDLDRACVASGRPTGSVTLSVMATCILGHNDADVAARAARVLAWRGSGDEDVAAFIEGSRTRRLVGTVDEIRARLGALAEVGVQRVMLQHLIHDDLAMIGLMGELVSD